MAEKSELLALGTLNMKRESFWKKVFEQISYDEYKV